MQGQQIEVSDDFQQAAMLLKAASKVLVITGAGISAESGVPTFRGEGEMWRDRHFVELASPDAFAADPRLIWDWYLYRRDIVAKAKPNAAHHALADWAKASEPGRVTLVTQNVDGLHEAAGHDAIRLHGSLWHNRCTRCGKEREDRSLVYDALPHSPCCNALERPAIVWFDEPFPQDVFKTACVAALGSQVILTIGTSGLVGTTNALVLAGRAARIARSIVIDVNVEDNAVHSHVKLRGRASTVIPDLLVS
jgi:NAD-dependent protein deacetylase/lipoamidase